MEKKSSNNERKMRDEFAGRVQSSRITFQTLYQELKERELAKKKKVEELRAQLIRAKREYSDARLDTADFEEAFDEIATALFFFSI